MEEIRNAALAYYETSSDKIKNMVRDFFKQLGDLSDGTVSISDLEAFFKERGHEPFPPSLLKELGKEPADHLDHFTDAFVFYYLAVTKRPCCDVCQAFLKGLYFTCLHCFENEDKTYNLCNNCFCEVKDCPKGHGHVAFLDNFAAFQAKSKATENLKKNMTVHDASIPRITVNSQERSECHQLFHQMELAYSEERASNPHRSGRLSIPGVVSGQNVNVFHQMELACSEEKASHPHGSRRLLSSPGVVSDRNVNVNKKTSSVKGDNNTIVLGDKNNTGNRTFCNIG
ncbi:hypothetical protein NC652_019101 [Populus alba x Populus x berolinensis]|uniref:EF-hand domain-containing protein n=1 Tax=Populus alba x Populus x berolinensis TaxID=444605 RepID=A0AAD6QHT4_9ROSI|nr:hypothetical protein NC652_019101 [Populus alba x Populus x berolinensis]KAJ6990625.1 hypothetical protein NC653_019017 [Populus alba x Populus x berolinensis]